MSRRLIASVLVCSLLAACATTNRLGRTQFLAPEPVSALYSEADMQLQLITVANTENLCHDLQCEQDHAFDRQVQRLGARLAQSAFSLYPDLKERIEGFYFVVTDKSGMGTASTSTGTILIFRDVGKLLLSDDSIAFLLAREMGRVIGRHHEENTAISISFSILAQVLLFPLSTAITTAASLAGSWAVKENNRSGQGREADTFAMELLARQGWNGQDVAAILQSALQTRSDDRWVNELHASARWADQLTLGPRQPVALVADVIAPVPLIQAAPAESMATPRPLEAADQPTAQIDMADAPYYPYLDLLLVPRDMSGVIDPSPSEAHVAVAELAATANRRDARTPRRKPGGRGEVADLLQRRVFDQIDKYDQRQRKLFVASTDDSVTFAPYLTVLRARLRGQLETAFPVSIPQRSMIVTLMILRDGTLRGVEMNHGSGDSGVDRRVLAALKTLGQFKPLPEADGEGVDVLGVTVRLPIV